MPEPLILPHSYHISPLQPFIPWVPMSTWTSPISSILYCNSCLSTLSSHSLCPGPVLHLIAPPPSNIWGWGACPLPHHYLSLLEGCPTIYALDVPPASSPLACPWVLHQEPLSTTTVSSYALLSRTLSLMYRIQILVLNPPTDTPSPEFILCMWPLSAFKMTSIPLWPLVSPTYCLRFYVTSSPWSALGILYDKVQPNKSPFL